MEIKRIGENQIRCALTEEEIQRMGFEIDEIIADTETTQRFMRVVLNLVEAQENISMEGIAPMVKAELLQDHSMAITFGSVSETSFQSLVDTVGSILNRLDFEKLKELHAKANSMQETRENTPEAVVCALRFASWEDMADMSRTCFRDRLPFSSLYKWRDEYYLLLDFTGFTKEEMRPYAFGMVEFDDGRCSGKAQIACIREHGVCLAKEGALELLMQL